ncbi:squalene--hopene cyclase [Dactylosporangium sp. NPDC048998]|uniref:squalene--hopene cyclase n=1 Tax=Dactylosporangium sp. NPDC048998 TaxID=3363976 RepID=UPI003721BE15
MVDLDAAIGYVVAHGDAVDRARLAWLRTGQAPPVDVLEKAETGQASSGGWPAYWGAHVASVDATCFRLAELDDLGAIDRPAARKALGWLGRSQRPDGMWEEDESLAGIAPPWAQPGDDEARLYLTTSAAFWLIVGGSAPGDEDEHAARIARAAEAFRASLRPDGTWPSFLVTGWLGCAVLYHLGWFYESAQIQVALADRVPDMSAADTAQLFASLRRIGMSTEDWLLSAARRRLSETQRSDGGWTSDDGDRFNVHTTLTAIRALR